MKYITPEESEIIHECWTCDNPCRTLEEHITGCRYITNGGNTTTLEKSMLAYTRQFKSGKKIV